MLICIFIYFNSIFQQATASRPQKEKSFNENTIFKTKYQNSSNSNIESSEELLNIFKSLDYNLNKSSISYIKIPRLFIDKLPADFSKITSVEKRKLLFIKSILPLILKENEKIENDRKKLINFKKRLNQGKRLKEKDLLWLKGLTNFYELELYDFKELLIKHDIVPPSLALAQAIIESGWGTSRFARYGNAVFGQWTFKKGKGIIPLDRVIGKKHEVRTFEVLEDSVSHYIKNLNYHWAYNDFRMNRAKLRLYNQKINGYVLAEYLTRYSSKGDGYIKLLKSIINTNNLKNYDFVKLRKPISS
ncbi:glucosaminidase domain-containing protein [Alphaproteobacteria bacterium]|nr:glucosaminidase domain-containing protein [Alphaproteobacteria bacterium]